MSAVTPTSLVDRIDALQSLTHVLVRARDLPHTFDAALDGLMRILGVSRASVLLFDEADVMRFVAWRGLSESYRRAVEGHTPWRRGTLDATPLLIPDVQRDPDLRPFLDTILAEGIRAMAFIPLVGESGVLGKFMVYEDEVREFAPADVLLAQTVAQQVAFAVERRRIEQRLVMQKTLLEAQSEAAADGILVVSPSGQIVSFNRRFVEMWKIPAAVIASRSDEAAIESVLGLVESPQDFVERVRYLYDHPEERSRDELALKDGRRFERYSAPVVGPGGINFGRVWFFRDMTERVRAEEQLRSEHAFRKAIEESMLAGVAAVDRAGRQTYVNPAFCRMVGWAADELVGGRPPFVYWPPEEIPAITSALEGVLKGALESVELRFQRRSGERFDVLLLLSPLRGGEGGSDEWLACVYDITDRKRDERIRAELLEKEHAARAEAEAASRAKDEFLAMLSHELRTPVNALLGWSRMLQRVDLDSAQRGRAIDAILRNAQLQAQLISDILDVSRIIKGKLPLSLQLVSVQPLVTDVLESFKDAAAAKRLSMTAHIDPSVPAMLVDVARFQQVLWNLVSNAIKFTPEGGAIHVAAALDGDGLEVSVRDSGVGIPVDFLPHVFERYRQADSSAARSHGGLGLGLAIVRHIVEMHGGNVRASSDGEGSGAVFTVTFPLRTTLPAESADAGAVADI